MFSTALFTLQGVGYLQDVIHKDNEVFAKINVIHRFNHGAQNSDDVWVTCRIQNGNLLKLMAELAKKLHLQKTIILEFDIHYLGFDFCQAGVEEDDPNYIISLQGVLHGVQACFINGSKYEDEQIACVNKLSFAR